MTQAGRNKSNRCTISSGCRVYPVAFVVGGCPRARRSCPRQWNPTHSEIVPSLCLVFSPPQSPCFVFSEVQWPCLVFCTIITLSCFFYNGSAVGLRGSFREACRNAWTTVTGKLSELCFALFQPLASCVVAHSCSSPNASFSFLSRTPPHAVSREQQLSAAPPAEDAARSCPC